jgi:hypothetical protein
VHITLAPTTHAPHLLLSITAEWEGAGAPSIANLASLLETLVYIADNAERANTPASSPRLSFQTDLKGPTAGRIRFRRIEFGSPLSIAVALPELIATATTGLAVFLYMFKRVFGFDLEVRAHRERMRQDMLEAQAQSARLETEIQALRAQPRDAAIRLDDSSSPWHREQRRLQAIDAASRTPPKLLNWTITEGTLTDDLDEDEFPEHASP